jgi:putative flippase GtrA
LTKFLSSQLSRYLIAGAGTVGLYVGGVWFLTEIVNWPARPVNAGLYISATGLSFLFNYLWVFKSEAKASGALAGFLTLQAFGVLLNIAWVEAGLRFTDIYPWIIAAGFFAAWPFLSFLIQRQFIFNR